MKRPFSLQAILGKILYPLYRRAAEKKCLECEPFIEKGSKILDLGCGTGIVGKTFQNYFRADVLGVDIQDDRIVDLPFQLIDGRKLPFTSNSFDIVFISHVLHHAKDYLDLMKEAKRVSKKMVIIYEDLPEDFPSNLFCRLHGFLFNTLCMFKSGKTYFQSEETWTKLFNSIGFQVIFQSQRKSILAYFYPIKYIQFILTKMGT